MNLKREAPAARLSSQAGAGKQDQHSQNTTTGRPIKWKRILGMLYAGRTLNTIEAQGVGETCLNTTIATLQRKGVMIARHTERVRGFQGCPTNVCRYRIDPVPENLARALALLGGPGHAADANTSPRSHDPAVDVGEHFRGLDRAEAQP